MLNPFDIILEKLEGLESKLALNSTAPSVPVIEIIDRVELCKRLDITVPTSIRWEKKGVIPCFRIGSSVRYNWGQVLEALEKKGKNETLR